MNRTLLIVILFLCREVNAREFFPEISFDLMVGASIGYRTITFSDERGSLEVAKFQSEGIGLAPNISLRTRPKYIWNDSNWAYTFSADFFTSKLEKQVIKNEHDHTYDLKNSDTEIRGLSIYLTPIIYYQFRRDVLDDWQYRAGLGAGVGYQNHDGTFLITNKEHPHYGKKEKVDVSGLALSLGPYFEARYKRHYITLNGNLILNNERPKPSGVRYQYLENNVSIKYQYQIYSF